jgi:hypothetical protein
VFVPIFSRGAINDSVNDRQNFARLTESSPCDNVLLEHCLALEFQHRGLIERVYPVLLGDEMMIDGEDGFAHYFNTGCHPDLHGDVVVKSVRDKIDLHLDRLCLGTALVSDFSVRSVEREILSSQGKVADGAMKPFLVEVTKDIREMMVQLRLHSKNVNKLTNELKVLKSQRSAIFDRNQSQNSVFSESLFGTPRSKVTESGRSEATDNKMVAMVARSLGQASEDELLSENATDQIHHDGTTEAESEALLLRSNENETDARTVNPETHQGIIQPASSVRFGVASGDTEEAKSQRSLGSLSPVSSGRVDNETKTNDTSKTATGTSLFSHFFSA